VICNESLLFSPDAPLPNHALHGFAYDGVDMICGSLGYSKFKARRGRLVKPGQDGSYIVVNRIGNKTVIGTDFSGYSTLFLYRSGKHWAVSNSFVTLAQHAYCGSGDLSSDLLSLHSHNIKKSLGFQTSLISMGIKEIQLVPVGQQVVIDHAPDGGSVTTEPIWSSKPALTVSSRYHSSMRHFLTTATGQMCTMLQSDADITCDITGGRDSRTVLAIMLFAARLLGISLNDRVHFNSRKNAGIDFQIATQLCNSIDVTLNRPEMEALTKRALHGDHGYKVWKQQHLGAHHQIMFPLVHRDSTHFWLSGNGGESHRYRHSFGPSPDVEHYFRSVTKTFPCDETRDRFLERLLDDLETQRQCAYSESDDLMLLYRSYRDRMHHGRRSRMFNAITPLSSKLLRQTSDHCTHESWENGLVLADIIANLAPDLLQTPFEKPYPGYDTGSLIFRQLFSNLAEDVDTSGELFRDPAYVAADSQGNSGCAMAAINDDFSSAVVTAKKLGIYSDDFLADAQQVMNTAATDTSGNPRLFGPQISHILLAAELSQLWR